MKILLFALSILTLNTASAAGNIEGVYYNPEGGKSAQLTEFQGLITLNTRSYYSNGAPSDYFFEFTGPSNNRDAQPGETFPGRIRSVDGYYGCIFDEPAMLKYIDNHTVQLHFPLLVFKKVTRSQKESSGTYYQRKVDWTRWGWVETIHSFPIERWRVISTECIITNKLPTTTTLEKVPGT